ncbi:unnamed protein product [Mytilus edulis]|uniref:ZMYM2-like/QRICH1 C-terminal domain-containing protein n=1 Tax=Mytilus edulis TaxID=6550 RepID=A0A8S3U4B2_MYTED|nr:unnamed protein product [Mytilus edulis]
MATDTESESESWESGDNSDTNTLLSEMDSPSCSYWDFLKPNSSTRYKNLPVNVHKIQKHSATNEKQKKKAKEDKNTKTNSDQTASFGTTSLAKASESERFRDVTDADIDSFLQEQLNKNTSKKTKSDLKIFQLFLKSKHVEKRNIEQIPPQQLDRYLNNNYHFGLRGVTEHYNLCWGDISLKVDTNGDEYLQNGRERQTKTRQCENITNLRKSGPIAVENKIDRTRCPVFQYKLFRQKRPETMKKEDSPFYIQASTFQDNNYESKILWYKISD